jgi:hypothetical protein
MRKSVKSIYNRKYVNNSMYASRNKKKIGEIKSKVSEV